MPLYQGLLGYPMGQDVLALTGQGSANLQSLVFDAVRWTAPKPA